MSKPLSVDLRERVVAAVNRGLSRRKAAERFGVSISSAIRWTAQLHRTGDVRPLRVGGDKRIEAYAPVILAAVEEKADITLAELRDLLSGKAWRSRSRRCGASSRGAGSRLKSLGTRPSRIVPTS